MQLESSCLLPQHLDFMLYHKVVTRLVFFSSSLPLSVSSAQHTVCYIHMYVQHLLGFTAVAYFLLAEMHKWEIKCYFSKSKSFLSNKLIKNCIPCQELGMLLCYCHSLKAEINSYTRKFKSCYERACSEVLRFHSTEMYIPNNSDSQLYT